MTTATLAKLERLLGDTFNKNRFRYNLLIDSEHLEANLINKSLSIGSDTILHNDYATQRCMMINLDPKTTTTNTNVLKQITKHMNACAGSYATVKHLGSISVGDTVIVES